MTFGLLSFSRSPAYRVDLFTGRPCARGSAGTGSRGDVASDGRSDVDKFVVGDAGVWHVVTGESTIWTGPPSYADQARVPSCEVGETLLVVRRGADGLSRPLQSRTSVCSIAPVIE